jgi:hypothetical protein
LVWKIQNGNKEAGGKPESFNFLITKRKLFYGSAGKFSKCPTISPPSAYLIGIVLSIFFCSPFEISNLAGQKPHFSRTKSHPDGQSKPLIVN